MPDRLSDNYELEVWGLRGRVAALEAHIKHVHGLVERTLSDQRIENVATSLREIELASRVAMEAAKA